MAKKKKMFMLGLRPPGKIKPFLDANSDSGSNNSKENPLLANTSAPNSPSVLMGNTEFGRKRIQKLETELGVSLCGCLGHMMVLFFPMFAMAMMMAFLIVLLDYDASVIQEYAVEENADINEVAKVYYTSVRTDSVSTVMSQYEPYWRIIVLSSIACVLVSMVTIARTIQIEVYQKRTESIVFMKFINYLATLINILSYVGLWIAVNFKVTQEDPDYAVRAHYIGMLSFFGGTAAYAVLHSFLLCYQEEYPTIIKVPFLILAIIITGSSLAFGIPIWQSGLASDYGADPIWEWVAVFTSALSIGMYVILFFVDPVDDVLATVFCGCCHSPITSSRREESRGRSRTRQSKQQLWPERLRQEEQAQFRQEEQARLRQEEQARLRQEEQVRLRREEQARLRQKEQVQLHLNRQLQNDLDEYQI